MRSHNQAEHSTEVECLGLVRQDPLLSFLYKALHCNIARAALFAVIVDLSVVLVPAGLISLTHPDDVQFLRMFEPQGLPLLAYIYFVVLPALWVYYVWQPIGVLQVVRDLFADHVVQGSRTQDSAYTTFVRSVASSFSDPVSPLLALAGAFSLLIVWLFALSPASPPFSRFDRAWWSINPFYFWLVYVPHVFVMIYIVLWILIRQIRAVLVFRRLFRNHKTTPKIFHPDRVNGLAPVGTFAIRSGLLALPFGLWLALQMIYPSFIGQGSIWLRFDTVALLLVYILTVPILVISPAWETHVAMRDYRTQALEAEAVRLRRALSGAKSGSGKEDTELIEYLSQRYRLLDEEYQTWPFEASVARRFVALYLVPIATSVAIALLERLLSE